MSDQPDLTKAPNFEALAGWMEQLAEWCDAAVSEIHGLKLDLGTSRQTIERLETDGIEEYVELVEAARDVGRGVSTFDELMTKLPSIHTKRGVQ